MAAPATQPPGSEQTTVPQLTPRQLVAQLFAGGNELLTAEEGTLAVKEDTRALVALFSNGRFFVCESHKFDGRVLSFEVLARKKKFQVGQPEYVPLATIDAIYKGAEQFRSESASTAHRAGDVQEAQKAFVAVISRAAAMKVSDVHVFVAEHTQIFFRVNGMMQLELEYSGDWGESFVRSAFASADISDANYTANEYQGAQKLGDTPLRGSGGQLTMPRNVLAVRLQFNPVAFGSQYLVMRLLYAEEESANNGDLKALGYTDYETDLFYRLRSVPVGICIVAGPTGSGKSTTLQRNMISMLQEKHYEINVITVEDPPEYPIPGARQMPVTNANSEAEKEQQFTKALSAALRSDPDILMIGEIRAISSAQLAFKGALSGHGVWSTLHANSAPAILQRFRDMGVEGFKLKDPEVIKGLISQRLVRKLCKHCRRPVSELGPADPLFQRVAVALGDFGLEQCFVRGPGCSNCGNRAFAGRSVIGEIIMPDEGFLALMYESETKKAIDYWTNDLGGRTMKDAAMEKMLQGVIDVEEVERWYGLLDSRPAI